MLLSADNLPSIGFASNGTGTEQGVRLWTGSTLVHLQELGFSIADMAELTRRL